MSRQEKERRSHWTLGELIEMEFGISRTPEAHATSAGGVTKSRPGAATPTDGGVNRRAMSQSTSEILLQDSPVDKASVERNGGAE